MTAAEFTKQMQKIAEAQNPEYAHMDADALMCELLRSLGYGDGVELFEKMEKWYA